jgi:hypothetical protein
MALVLGVAPAAHPQCRQPDDFASFVVNMMAHLVTSTEPELMRSRTADSLTALPASEVALVTDASVCKRALIAYNRALGSRGTGPTASTTVIVVKVGSERYTVADPGQMCGEFIYGMMMNKEFDVLRVFTI